MERAGHDDKTMIWAISWILNSRRPLRMDELCDLLAYQKGAAGKISEPREIVQVCQGLIVYDEFSGIVEFPHSTIREFFEQNYEGPHTLLSAADLASVCIDYLASDAFEDGPCQNVAALRGRLEKHKASLYVAQFWALHTDGEAEKCPRRAASHSSTFRIGKQEKFDAANREIRQFLFGCFRNRRPNIGSYSS